MTEKRPRGRPKKKEKTKKKAEYGKVDIGRRTMAAVIGKNESPVKTPKKLGRPCSYKPEYCEQLIEHMAKGYSYESFAADINATRAILYLWEKSHPDFFDAKKIGTEKCLKWWEKIGVGGMVGKYPGFQASIWIFNMKNRFKWTDKHEVVLESRIKEDLKAIETMSSEELKQLAIEAADYIETEIVGE